MADGQVRISKSGILVEELMETENRVFFLARMEDHSPVAYTQLVQKMLTTIPNSLKSGLLLISMTCACGMIFRTVESVKI